MSEQQKTQKGQCENCLPDATVWATSTPTSGPKSYFVLIKDGDQQIALEIKYSQADKAVTADIYTPGDYSYTLHDHCDHANLECVEDDPDFQEQLRIDEAADRAGVVKP